jgi:ribosomal protein S18 acetylase RimI-like enzyme
VSRFEIRRASEKDLDECIWVIREAFSTVTTEFNITQENCPTNRAFIEKVHLLEDFEKGNLMYVLAADQRIVGFMQLKYDQERSYELKNMAVLPGKRHMGYGKALLDFAKAQVLELGGSVIEIGIIEENTILKNWYIANGFKHIGTKKFDHLPFTVGFMEYAVGELSQE